MSYFLSRLPDKIDNNTNCIIMLHGVWSNEQDIFHLAPDFPPDTAIFSLRWPFSLGRDRYAWYPVDFSTGNPVYSPIDLKTGYQSIVDSVREIQQEYNISINHTFLLGFSQGAMMACYTFWKSGEILGGIIALSGRLLDEIDLENIDEDQYEWKKVFIGHGVDDAIIPMTSTGPMSSFSRKLGIESTLKFYTMGHSIVGEEVKDIISWINQ